MATTPVILEDELVLQGTYAYPIYPGAPLDSHTEDIQQAAGKQNLTVQGTDKPESFSEGQPHFPPVGGVLTDDIALYGHGAPTAFMPESPGGFQRAQVVNQDVHSFDTGGYDQTFKSPLVHSAGWWLNRIFGRKYSQQSQVTDNAGWDQPLDAGSSSQSQFQGQNAGASNPLWMPYAERPLYAATLHVAMPTATDNTTPFTPAGSAAEIGPLYGPDQSGVAEQPPDPSVSSVSSDGDTSVATFGFWG